MLRDRKVRPLRDLVEEQAFLLIHIDEPGDADSNNGKIFLSLPGFRQGGGSHAFDVRNLETGMAEGFAFDLVRAHDSAVYVRHDRPYEVGA